MTAWWSNTTHEEEHGVNDDDDDEGEEDTTHVIVIVDENEGKTENETAESCERSMEAFLEIVKGDVRGSGQCCVVCGGRLLSCSEQRQSRFH